MPTPRPLAIMLAVLASALAGEAVVAAGATSDPAKAAPAGANVAAMAPLEFFLARGEADACGPGCNEWIAAEGKIDPGTAQRLRRLLTKLGRRRPPIYFHSPGGSIVGSIELGRLIREQKFEVSVAHTIPLGCDRDKPLEQSCEAQKRSGQELDAEFDPAVAMCNSACVYAVAGGAVRRIPPWVKLGIHDVGFDPAKTQPRGALLGEAKRLAHARIHEYLREMGIDEALFRAAAAVPFESKRFLEREELVRFGIDRREFGETGWQFVDKPAPAMSKRFFARTESDPVRYLDGFVSLDCGVGQAIRLALARPHDDSDTLSAWARFLSVNGHRFDLPYQIPSRELDARSTSVPASTFDALGDTATIGLSEPAAGATLNMHGFSAAYAKLRRSCDEAARNAVAVALPKKPIPYLDAGTLRALSPPAAQGPTRAQNTPAAPVAARPETARSALSAPDTPAQSEPVQQGCGLHIAEEPQHVTGRVTGFVSGEEALAITRRVEARLGAKISPAYLSLKRATVERYPEGGNRPTRAAIPENMAVRIGDVVELNSRYADKSLPCHFIPWTIDRLVDHVE
ncbi:MAG TPA: hypothetical protein VGL31_16360 [Xanthobacteraceae bacterium]